MFKLESYITPIILSYVDKYIKNFRPEDSQVSLWGGDASFHNLDLRLEVLEQELHLPFSFVSGHIHELLIHVPWTKLASEPITITINTIECILKLRGSDTTRNAEKTQNKERMKKNPNRNKQVVEAPTGYVQMLITKIINNIRIYCNNLILKYVEEDIVLSMNVKLLTFESANEQWEAAYTDVHPTQVLLRKLIAVNDLTVCLDKRNASGKIDVYQEPMLYRCSMVIHFLRNYFLATAKRASVTRIDICCNSMEFSMTEQQIPMLMRLIFLLQALQQKQIKSDIDLNVDVEQLLDGGEFGSEKQSLAGWAWSLVPSILPTKNDDIEREQQMLVLGHTLHIGFYVDDASLTFKVSEASNDKGNYYSHKKLKYYPILTYKLQGILSEMITHGKQWSQFNCGISQMLLLPIGHCSCSTQDVFDNMPALEYLKAGSISNLHKSDSLFDAVAAENNAQNRKYNTSWEKHVDDSTEGALLERTPAFAIDYLYQLTVPDDMTSENLSELGSDLEYSNLSERALLRIVIGPLKMRICSGFLHRISSLKAAASAYDYIPYSIPKPEPELSELPPPNADDFDALNENIPTRVVQLTILAPVIEFHLLDHSYFAATKGYLFKKRKKTSLISAPSAVADLPRLTLECQCIDLRLANPMYPKRLVTTTCQLPDPPKHMFDACHSDMNIKVIGFCSRLIINHRQTTILMPSSASYNAKSILMPQYWVNPNIPHYEVTIESDSITATGTNPKMVVIAQIIDKLIKRDTEDSINLINNSSLLQDATRTHGLVYLEFCIEGINFKRVQTNSTTTIDLSLGSIKAFIFEPIDILYDSKEYAINESKANYNFFQTREIQQVLIVSGPECEAVDHQNGNADVKNVKLLSVTIQFPLCAEKQIHPSLIHFDLKEIRICIDPLLCKWLRYTPKNLPLKTEVIYESMPRKLSRSYSDISTYETTCKQTPHESVHSSLEQTTFVPMKTIESAVKEDDNEIDLQERIYNFLKKWFDVWKGLLIFGDISQCTIYFPIKSLSAVGSQGIQQAVDNAMQKENPPDIFVFTLPTAMIRNSSHKDSLTKYIQTSFPVLLPEQLWTKKKSSFPWSIIVSDLCCYTCHNGVKSNCLGPVSLTSTVGMSTKSSKIDIVEDSKTMETLNIHFANDKGDIRTFGVYIHVDMTPIIISISEVQVCLISSLLRGLVDVAYNIFPDKPRERAKVETTSPLPERVQEAPLSPSLFKESLDSLSEKMAHVSGDSLEAENIKLTAWIQWTITRFTIELLAYDSNDINMQDIYIRNPKLKFVIDAEDIVSSLDFQNVYLKLKGKVSSASIMHYIKDEKKNKWVPGEFLGFVMRAKEEAVPSDRQEDTSFASITLTRASCKHTHNLWGAVKNKSMEKDENAKKMQKHSRYITEIVLNLQPIDILLSPTTLKNYFLVVEPLINILSIQTKATHKTVTGSMQISNRTLPLVYLDFYGFRFIMPSVDLDRKSKLHDACLFEIKRITLAPTAENPICRLPLRPDIYQQAAQARILNIPGSDVEDRQYQLDIIGISMSTSTWNEISRILKYSGKTMSMLRTMSENPALEWNSLGKGKLNNENEINYCPLITKFDISIVAAPAMIYKRDIICGHSIEINFISDIKVSVSLEQIHLLFALLGESSYAFDILISNKHILKRPKIIFPYSPHNKDIPEDGRGNESDMNDVTRDSGIDTSDLKSTSFSMRTKENTYLKKKSDISEKSAFTPDNTTPPFGKSVITATKSFIPLDILVTGGKISISLYEFNCGSRKHNLATIKSYETESEKGYEASEEGSSDEKIITNQFKPLICIILTTPNALLSDTQIGRKIQLSFFDFSIKICSQNHKIVKSIPNEEDFCVHLLETKSGEPNVDTGILPAFFTLKWTKGIGKPATLDLHIAKPTKILFSMARWLFFLQIYETISNSFKISLNTMMKGAQEIKVKRIETHPPASVTKSGDHYSKFKEIKEKLFGITILNVNFAQVILTIQTSDTMELNLSFASLKNHFTIISRPEKLTNTVVLDCMSVGMVRDGEKTIILNPWTVTFEVALFWESWQNANSNPQMQISIDSDCFVMDVSPDKILYLQHLQNEFREFCLNLKGSGSAHEMPYKVETIKMPAGEKEQHYKDDLRAGAFQFVDATNNNPDELPLPYQVMFWNRNISAMAWRYPQPRALTKVRVFPVPFKIAASPEDDQQVLCHLEYWSDCHGCYQPYTQFYLSETEMCHLELPKLQPQLAVACTWRVMLSAPNNQNSDMKIHISPRALAGCIRIDSYFNKNLIPDLTVALHIGTININLFNYFDKKRTYTLPSDLKHYTHDMFLPDYQHFLTLNIEKTNAYLATWKFEMLVFDVNSITKCTILDYAYLTNHMLIAPFSSKLEISASKSIGINFISKPIHIMFGASAAHTLAVSAQMWSQAMQNVHIDIENDLIIMTYYVICNDTNINLRFGQAGLEDIFLPSRYCHLYTWRSQKCKQMLRVALEENGWTWSEPFYIDKDGTEMYTIPDEATVIVVTVKSLSATQKQIIFSGQFVLCNMLLEHFDLKVFECSGRGTEREMKLVHSNIVKGKSIPPSMLIDSKKTYFMRLRFFGLESAWTGDIPLAENMKCAQPWLVKVPLQERGQFLSVWCRIVMQPFKKGTKILAMLWPLFMIRSNLPINTKVHIETPTLNVQLEATVRGLGEYQQLYCPGTIDHSHQLRFQLDNNAHPTNPYVPLNYSLVDQKQFFRKCDGEDINEIISVINNYDKCTWDYFKDDFDYIHFTIDEQPLTHVQVRYQNACKYSSALLIELLPWSLLVNLSGCSIALVINEKELCRINHYGIITPPKLEETFYIGVGICGTWNMSPPLQLAKSNWSQTFYMPQISGTVPLDGSIRTTVHCTPYISVLSIVSSIVNEIRLLKIASSHVLTSHLSMQLQVIAFAVPETQTNVHFPKHFDKHTFTLPPHLHRSQSGIPIIQWFALGNYDENTPSFALYLSFSMKENWSCPIRVDKCLTRKSISIESDDCSIPLVVVSQENKGQVFLSLHHDFHPQLFIENKSGTKVYCAQVSGENSLILKDSEHLNWLCAIDDEHSAYYTMPMIAEKFPELPANNYSEYLVLASDPESDPQGILWSTPINVTTYNDQFVRIPFYGDVKVSIKYSVHTINILIESVSQVEISARDIRVRLSQHESEQNKLEIHKNSDLKATASTATIASSYFSAEESVSTSSTDLTSFNYYQPNFNILPIFKESYQLPTNHSFAQEWIQWSGLRILAFIQCVTFTLTSDLEAGCSEKVEISSLTCDNVSATVTNAEVSHVCLCVSDIQIDNQLYSRGCYDFPVLLVGQENNNKQIYKILNMPMIQLVQKAQENCLIKVDLSLETWNDVILNRNVTDIRDLKIKIESMLLFIEDVYVMKLMDNLNELLPSNLILWSKTKNMEAFKLNTMYVPIPAHLICGSTILSKPLSLHSFTIEPISISLSVHASIKLYLALDQSPLQFSRFDKKRLFTTSYRLGHALTMHYLSGAIFGAGWVVGSLELLGSPGGLARAMGSGLRDFVSLPYHGLVQGPWAFLRGVSYGSASLMKHITAGTLQSVTKLASSVARNLDRLTLDEEHLKRTEEFRRQRPQGLTQGLMQGLTGLGISLLGAVGGIAHHPLQSVMTDGASPRSLMAGFGKGIVGVFTKPLSGAAELVALTGQGLLQGAGWNRFPESRMNPVINHIYSNPNSMLKYKWKFIQSVTQSNILFVTEATSISLVNQYDAVALILTSEALIIVDTDEDMSQRVLSLSELSGFSSTDPTLLCLKIKPPFVSKQLVEDEVVEMDPACRARVADYVRSTVGLMQLSDNLSPEHSEMSISPNDTPACSPNGGATSDTVLTFYVNPQSRNYFLCLLELAKQQSLNYNFPVL